MKRSRTNKSNKRIAKNNPYDFVSFKLHGIKLVDDSNLHVVESIAKSYNSAKRCAIKRFQSIGLNGMTKGQVPIDRDPLKNFKDFQLVDGHPSFYQGPVGMSKDLWYRVRKDAYLRKRIDGLRRAKKMWQLDKDLGSPISGTERVVGEWVKSHEFNLDSVMVHNAILDGLKTYRAFEKKLSKYQTKKTSPSFGDMEGRSRKDITKDEFQLTRNGSFTVVGQSSRGGNPKFRFKSEEMDGSDKMELVFQRKWIEFDLSGNRFSQKGYKRFCNLVEMMNQGKIPVTVTLSRERNNRFEVTMTYSQQRYSSLLKEISNKAKRHLISSIYFTDEVLCHQVVDAKTNKVLHFKAYDIDKSTGNKNKRHLIESLKWDGKLDELAKLERKMRNATITETQKLIGKLFRINKSYGVGCVVMETPRTRNSRNFNNSLLEFDPSKIRLGNANPCFMSASRLVNMVKNQCTRNGMKFNSVNGAFLQLESLLDSEKDMNEALENACSILVKRNFAGFDIRATDWGKMMSHHPSMLDWVGHLLHKKQNRQARCEIRNAFVERAVEKAVRLCDSRSRCGLKDEGRHSCTLA